MVPEAKDTSKERAAIMDLVRRAHRTGTKREVIIGWVKDAMDQSDE